MTIITLRTSLPLMTTLGLLGATGCKGTNGGDLDTVAAAITVDSANVGSSEGALFSNLADGTETITQGDGPPGTAADVALYLQAHVGDHVLPAGCATATTSGATTTITYANCTGPRGLVSVDGTIAITAAIGTGGAITFSATATDFTIGELAFDIDDSAVYTVANGTKSIAVTTSGTATGPLGGSIVRHGDYTVTYTDTCGTVDGAWSTVIADAARSTTVDLQRCAGACASGTVTRDTFDGRVITITFDGSATANWTSSTGRSGSFALACE